MGDLAKQLFPHGVEVEFLKESDGFATASLQNDSSNCDGMITKTKELINNGCEVIYKATFKENGIF